MKSYFYVHSFSRHIAMALGVDEIINGSLVETHEGRTFILRRIGQQRAKVIYSVTKRLEASNGEEFLLAIGPILQTLYPARELQAGTQRGVSERMVLRLNPPPIPKWITDTGMGATTAAGIFSGISYVVGNQVEFPSHFFRSTMGKRLSLYR